MLFSYLIDFLKPVRSRTAVQPMRRDAARCRPKPCRLAVEALDDRIVPAATFSIGNAVVVEGNAGTQYAIVTVNLDSAAKKIVTVDYSTSNDTATAGSDYTAVSGRLTFAKNEMSKTILIPVIGDRIPEPAKSFRVTLSNPTQGMRIANGTGYVTIIDDEPRISFSSHVSQLEGNSSTTPMTFTVQLSNAYDLPVTVHWATANGSAVAGIDYIAGTGTLVFAKGETSKTIQVLVNGDRVPEPDRNFSVNLSSPDSYAVISNCVAVGTILDSTPRITISDAYQNYGDATITFTVTRSRAYDEVVTVDFATADGTARAGVDYVATFGTLTFVPGETTKTITITVLDPTSVPDKYLFVHLGNATANALVENATAGGYWYYEGATGGDGYYDGPAP